MKSVFTTNYQIPSYELDCNRTLKLSSAFKYIQETAGRHLLQDSLSYEEMRKRGVVFLLTKIAAVFRRMPENEEMISVRTWFRGIKGAQFLRNIRFLDENKITLMEAETQWVIVNPDSHRIIRPTLLPFSLPDGSMAEDVAIRAKKIETDCEVKKIGSRRVRKSDIDCNNHVNNAVYADIVLDFLPADIQAGNIAELHLSFLGEALLGEEIVISAGKSSQGEYYFEGSTASHKCFEALAKIK